MDERQVVRELERRISNSAGLSLVKFGEHGIQQLLVVS